MSSNEERIESGGRRRQRLFFALWPGEELRVSLRRLTSRVARRCSGRRVHPDNLHLTLLFLGGVDPQARPCLEAVADTVRVPPFPLDLDRLGFFSGTRSLWVGTVTPPEALEQLVDQLAAGMPGCGITPEERVFIPHVTLLRRTARGPASCEVNPLQWPVDEFVLVESHTLAEGPRYQVLRRWPLQSRET